MSEEAIQDTGSQEVAPEAVAESAAPQNFRETLPEDLRTKPGIMKFKDVPGLAQGYTSTPSGGYTQANARDYIMPKDTNELRVNTNPKVTYEGRIINGLKSSQRGMVAKPRKNRPETYYASDPERGNPSAAIKTAMMRKKFCMKRTNKQNQRSYFGGLGNTEISKPKKESAVRKSTKNN